MEQIYSPRHDAKDAAGGGSSSFEQERVALFLSWVGSGKNILDLGCRDGRIARKLIEAGNTVTGFDIDSAALRRCPPEMKTEQHDLNADWHIGHDGEFDVVIATEVIEHIYYPKRVVEKIASVLKPGGYFIGSVPNAFNLKNRVRLFLARPNNTPLGEPTHINHFSCAILRRVLERYFSPVEIRGIVQAKYRYLAKILPGLGSFLLAFRARKSDQIVSH